MKQYRELKNNPENYYHREPLFNLDNGKMVTPDKMDKIIDLYAFENEDIKYYTRVSWKEKYKKIAGSKFMENIEAMKKLDSNFENVRAVFWFDH